MKTATQNTVLTAQDLRAVNRIKKEYLTNSSATPSSNSKLEKELSELAKKYNTGTQQIFDLSTFKN